MTGAARRACQALPVVAPRAVALAAIQPMRASLPPLTLALLALGGALYASGIIFYLWKNLKFQNAIWHGFVMVAVGCHYGAIAHVMVGA